MRSLQRGAVAALLVTTACAVAACGGGGSSAATTSAGTTANTTTSAAGAAGGANGAAFAKYTTCLKQHGVTLPNFGQGRPPGGGGQGTAPTGTAPNPPTGTNRRRGGFGQFNSSEVPEGGRRLREPAAQVRGRLRRRLRRPGRPEQRRVRGLPQLPDVARREDDRRLRLRPPGGAAPTAKEKAALTACASLRPARGARPTGTTATPSTTTHEGPLHLAAQRGPVCRAGRGHRASPPGSHTTRSTARRPPRRAASRAP